MSAIHSMKKLFLTLVISLLGITNLFAARANSNIAKIALADGTVVSARLYGDENFHYYMTLDGTPLKKNAEGKYEKSTQEELKARQVKIQASRVTRASGIGTSSPSYFPHSGNPKALVILVQFQDVKFKSTDPVATFNHYLNAESGAERPTADATVFSTKESNTNYGSVKQYFTDMSMGAFTPQFDIVGPVTVSQNSAYYGKDRGDNTDVNFKQMISEACAKVADQVNFTQYDSDNDGYVDLVCIIYAGYSQSVDGNSDDCLWPKSGYDNLYKYDTNGQKVSPTEQLAYNGKTISRYCINNELNETPNKTDEGKHYLAGIGIFCHEFSHTLGLPDLYDTNGNYQNDQCPDYWDLMDGGSYTYNGYRPTPYSPWEKEIMGWSTPVTLEANKPQQLTLAPYSENSQSYKIEAETGGEYLLLQNIQNTGWYKYLLGYGMLVWRIDYADKASVSLFDNPNNTPGSPRVTVVPADGKLIYSLLCGDNKEYSYNDFITSAANDPFPAYGIGKDGKDIDYLTSVKLNHSTLTSRPLYNIKKDETTGMVTFDYLKDYTTGISSAIVDKADHQPTQYFDLEGRKVETPQKGHLYITNKGKKIMY